MWNFLVDKLIAHAKKTPYFHLQDYMERYWLIRPGKLPFAIRLHHILRSDIDRHLHTHPWNYTTFILKGGYFEITVDKYGKQRRKWYGPGQLISRKANSQHRLVIPTGQTAWTLFIHGRKRRDWGFVTEEGEVYWREYLNQWDESKEGNAGPVAPTATAASPKPEKVLQTMPDD